MKQFFVKTRLVLLVLLLISSTAVAQFTLTGTVQDAKGEVLIGATLVIKGSAAGTVTDLDGSFTLRIPGESATLLVSYTGYTEIEQPVSSARPNIVITLQDESTTLDEIVITGFATSVKRSNLANSVATISGAQLTGVTNQSTMDGALYGKFRGAQIQSNSGAPGGGMSVRLRGVTSIFGDQQPLYIIDGVFVDNSTISLGTNIVSAAAGGGNTATNQDDASNRIADIDPEDIENIEILKGASAAAIYGSRAAGGVVIITTKRGKAGRPRITLSQTFGASRPISLLGMREWNAAKIGQVFSQADVDKFNQNGLTDYEAELFDHTRFNTITRFDMAGGNDKLTFFAGGAYRNEDGLVENTGYEKSSVRLNLGYKFNDWLDIDVTNSYVNSQADRGFFNNSNTNSTVGYALAFTRPWENLFPDDDGVYPAVPTVGSNVLETVNLITNREKINRYIGGASLNVKIITTERNSLRAVFRGGLDQYTLRTTAIFPKQLSYMREPGSLEGVSVSGTTINSNTNLQAFLVYTHTTDGGTSFRTQVGLTAENFDQNTVITTATGLNGSQTNIGQSTNVAGFQNIQEQNDRGFFAQEEFNWQDRIVLTAGVRADKSTNNGDANKLYFYPKANGAVNLHEFDLWSSEVLSAVKLRAAYGQSGRFANFQDRFNLYNGTLIGGNSGLFNNPLRGNTNVGPERQSELELGTDIGLFKNNVTLDITYYNKEIDDLLLRQQVPTSSGYTARVVNAGALRNRGIEIGLDATPVKGDFTWNTSVNFWKNRSEVTRLDIPAFNLGGFAASLGQYRIQQGKSATQIVGTYNRADCENNDCSDLDPDGDGFRVYGDAEPDFNMSFINSFSYKNFEFSFLVHWKKGGEGINLSTLLYDLGQLTWDYDDTNLDPNGQIPNGQYRTSQWFSGNTGPWVEDSGYIRLREVGAYYNIPRSVFNDAFSLRVGVSGRNLINIFNYNSYDPEASNFGGNVLANNVEVTPFPSTKRINFHITARF